MAGSFVLFPNPLTTLFPGCTNSSTSTTAPRRAFWRHVEDRPVCRERGERHKPHNHLQEYSSNTKSSKILLTLGFEIPFWSIYMLGHNTQKLFLTQLIKSTTNKTLQGWSEMNLAIPGLVFSRTVPSPASGLEQIILTWRDLVKMSGIQHEAWEEIEGQYLLLSQNPHSLHTTHLIAEYVWLRTLLLSCLSQDLQKRFKLQSH